MILTVTSPATLLELAELSGARSRLEWAVAREMWVEGTTFVGRVDGRPVALCGLYPLGQDAAEAWFNVMPEASRHMLAVVRAIRLTLGGAGYREIVTVATGRAGERIARAAGFSIFGETELGKVYRCLISSAADRR